MIRIAILQAAFEAIARTLPLGSVSFENAANEKGERLIWLERQERNRSSHRIAVLARATARSSCG
jgi:hypothetical protein